MAAPRTRPTDASVEDFLAAVPDERRRADCRVVAAMMQRVTGAPPVMWGPSIVGFGAYRQPYANGSVLEWPVAAFSPRKQDLTLYIMPGFEQYGGLMARLGKHRTGKTCLYLKRLSDVDLGVLEQLVAESFARVRAKYP